MLKTAGKTHRAPKFINRSSLGGGPSFFIEHQKHRNFVYLAFDLEQTNFFRQELSVQEIMGRRADQDTTSIWYRVGIRERFVIAFEARSRVDHVTNYSVLKPGITSDASSRHFPFGDSRAHAHCAKPGLLPVASQHDQPSAHCQSTFDSRCVIVCQLVLSCLRDRHAEERHNTI